MAKNTYSAKANKVIKYGGKFIKEGEKFEVKIADVDEMKAHAEISIPATAEGTKQEGGQEGKAGA